MNMTAIAITAIICLTLVVMVYISNKSGGGKK